MHFLLQSVHYMCRPFSRAYTVEANEPACTALKVDFYRLGQFAVSGVYIHFLSTEKCRFQAVCMQFAAQTVMEMLLSR